MPAIGVMLSKLLGYLSIPSEYLQFQHPEYEGTVAELIKEKVQLYSLVMVCVAIASGLGVLFQKISFSFLGGNVTYEIRQILYDKVLRKNIGWFDQKEHASGILTKTMSHDTALINGVATEGLPP